MWRRMPMAPAHAQGQGRAEHAPRRRGRHRFDLRRILVVAAAVFLGATRTNANDWREAASDLLAKGNAALSTENVDAAIQYYASGIHLLPHGWSGAEEVETEEAAASSASLEGPDVAPGPLQSLDATLILSLHTNHGTALASARGGAARAVEAYRAACRCYRRWRRHGAAAGDDGPRGLAALAARAHFLLGTAYQDAAGAEADAARRRRALEEAAKAYAAATDIDPQHWSSFANRAVVLADVGPSASLGRYEEAILAYQRALAILTGVRAEGGEGRGPTDPPDDARGVVAELQYRVGLCLVPFLFAEDAEDAGERGGRWCTLAVGPTATATTRSCLELGAYQFQTALDSRPDHEGALNALALATADATFGMSTDVRRVQTLFEDYAPTFERSLLGLGYNGFHRMRRSFNKVLASEGREGHVFSLAVDAGCGTGLAGEVFKNITETLVGIDLSPSIIKLANESRPNLYSEFVTGDIQEILHQYALQKKHISLLVAADTLVYFNDLNNLFEAMALALEEGGYVILSLENVSHENEQRLDQLKPEWRWQLTPSGRVAHRRQYVEALARTHALGTVLYETLDDFREEKGTGVRGHLFVLQKRAERREEL